MQQPPLEVGFNPLPRQQQKQPLPGDIKNQDQAPGLGSQQIQPADENVQQNVVQKPGVSY